MEKYYKKISIAIIIIGIILRFTYISYTSISERQHDNEEGNNYSHIRYIEILYETHKLPDSNRGQFYHPPLNYIISAGFLKLENLVGISQDQGEENLQILTAIYSSVILIVIYFILNKVPIKKIYKLIIMLLMAVYPSFIILAGTVNNDILAILFEFLIILYLLKWHEDSSIKNTILLGIFTAAALLTKVSTMLMGLPIAIVFIDKFMQELFKDKKSVPKYILKFLLYAVIAVGIGFLYIIRNKILFGQSPLYVLKVVNDYFCGDRSYFERFTLFSSEWLTDTFCNSLEECNMFAWIIRSSVFGEYRDTSGNYTILAQMIKWTNAIFIFVGIFALIRILVKSFIKRKEKKENSILKEVFLITYFTMIATYVYGNLTMPYGCTMDFRYIVPTAFFGIVFIFMDLNESENKIYRNIVYLLSGMFVILNIISVFTLMKCLAL